VREEVLMPPLRARVFLSSLIAAVTVITSQIEQRLTTFEIISEEFSWIAILVSAVGRRALGVLLLDLTYASEMP